MDGEPPEKLQRGTAASFTATMSSVRARSTTRDGMPLSLSSLTLGEKKEEFLKLKVLTIHLNYIIAGKDTGDARLMRISKKLCPTDYTIRRGDWLQIKVTTENHPDSEEKLEVLSVNWLEVTGGEGVVTAVFQDGEYLADNSIFFYGDAITKFVGLKVGDKVELVSIKSDQCGENVLERKRRHSGFGTGEAGTCLYRFKKRAVKVTLLEAKAPTKVTDEWDDEDEGSHHVDVKTDPKFEQLLRNKNRICIRPADCLDLGSMVVGSTVSHNVEIENNTDSEVILREVKFWGLQNVCMFQAEYHLPGGVQYATIWPRGSLTVKVHCCAESLGRTKEMCVFDFGSGVRIGRWIKANSISEDTEWWSRTQMPDVEHWRQKQARIEEKGVEMVADWDRVVLHGPALHPSPSFQRHVVPSYSVPKALMEVFHHADLDLLQSAFPVDFTNLTSDNYLTRFKVSLWLEELENELQRKGHDMNSVVLKTEGRHLALEVPHFNEIKPPLMRGDKVRCIAQCVGREIYTGTIEKIMCRTGWDPKILLRFQDYFHSRYDGSPVERVQFCNGRTVYIRQHHAIERAVNRLGTDWLFPTAVVLKPARLQVSEVSGNYNPTSKKSPSKQPNPFRKDDTEKLGKGRTDGGMPSYDKRFQLDVQLPPKGELILKWFNKSLNEEQKEAVRGLLHARARPLPYVIFGPPGTGKTVTLVEGVMQVYFLEATSRILVAVPSNAGADLVAKRLVETKLFKPGDFVRLNGFLRSEDAVLDEIVPFCEDGTQLDVIGKYRLIICTTNTTGQFFQLGKDAINFSHVFIDEAGYATEPDLLIPCVMAAVEKEAVVTMAGDPNQLGPVLMNDMKINRILRTSLLERLMQTKVYLRDAESNLFNRHLVTKLVKSYRSHPLLLTVPSLLFYSRELVSCVGEDAYEFCDKEDLSFLPNPKQPLIFLGVKGNCRRDKDSPSYYNMEEVDAIAKYVLTLRRHEIQSDDIGIITPYRKQADKISFVLRRRLEGAEMPKIASVQEFQGGEKKVIIISTVRSEYEHAAKHAVASMEFIYSPKLFNVAITRAKALLIVIGNPDVLCLNPFWGCLLKFSIHHGAYTGCDLDAGWDKKLEAAMQDYSNGSDCSSDNEDVNDSPDDEGGYGCSQESFDQW